MPIFVQFTPACDRQGCGAIDEKSAELASFTHGAQCPPSAGWGEHNGEILCPDHMPEACDGD